MRLLGVESQDLPGDLAINDNQRHDGSGTETAHGGKAVTTVGRPETFSRRYNSNHRIEIAAGLRDHICQALVMGIRKVPLKWRGLDRIDRQNRKQHRMAAKRLLVPRHDMTTYLFNRGRGITDRSLESLQD